MLNISRMVKSHAKRTPERLAVVYEDNRITYGELAVRMTKLAAGLASGRAAPGDIVAVLMKNSAAFLEIALAVSEAGAVLLPINFRLSAEEVEYITHHAGAKLLFVDEEFSDKAPMGVDTIIVDAAGQGNSSGLLEVSKDAPALPIQRNGNDLFRLMYTSGTTDRPKGVMHTYSNYFWKTADHIAALELTAHTRLLIAGPLYHVGGFDLPGLAVLWTGGVLVVLRDFDPEFVLSTIEAEQIDSAWFAPVMTTMLLSFPDRRQYDVSSLRWVIGGGERTPENRIREFSSFFKNARYIDAFGMTETCSGDTFMVPGREIEKIGSTGLPVPFLDISIRDDSGAPVAAGIEGEICMRGPKVTSGYWRDPDKTTDAFFGEWFRSGDVGYLDDEGFLYLTDRKKDMIISGGENIASSEVERVILALSYVREAAVIGVPDVQWGERPVAVIGLDEGAVGDAAAIITHCRSELAGFKAPKEVHFVEALPRNPSGKVLKRVLRDQFCASSDRN